MTLSADSSGKLDHRSLEAASREELRDWVEARLNGRDLTVSGGGMGDEGRHVLFQVLIEQVSDSTREKLREVVVALIRSLADSRLPTWSSEAREMLLQLAVPVLRGSHLAERGIQALLQIAEQLEPPTVVRGALQAIAGFRRSLPTEFWISHFRGPEFIPVVFEGLAASGLGGVAEFLVRVASDLQGRDSFEFLLPFWIDDYGASHVGQAFEEPLRRLDDPHAIWLAEVMRRHGLHVERSRAPRGGLAPLFKDTKRIREPLMSVRELAEA
jgi:hypothetical protein